MAPPDRELSRGRIGVARRLHSHHEARVRRHNTGGIVADTTIKQLIDGLNEDLRGEFQAVIMYRLFASMVQGPYRQELRTFFTSEIPEELGHAQILADKISALGGTPAAVPAAVKVVADAKDMLQAALDAEVQTIDRYVKRRKQAEDAAELGLAAEFDQVLADETRHRDELLQMLARWP
jgi:bacterioferritin